MVLSERSPGACRLLVVALFGLLAQSAVWAKAPAACPRAMHLEAAEIQAEAVCLLRQYVAIDTTNPPGNELATAKFLKAYLKREGIESQIFESAPGRANLYARVRGDGSAKALMLVHHMDVVPASVTDWSVPPFAGLERDGYVWGRGTVDNKGPGLMEVLAVVMVKRLQLPLARDLVLLAVADEEQGGGKGARYMMAEHADLFKDVEFALNEGGLIVQLDAKRRLNALEFAQKVPLWVKLTASGPAGHASAPKPAAATHVLVRALARLEQFQFPITVVPEVQTVFSYRANALPPAEQDAWRHLETSLQDEAFRTKFMADPRNALMVRNSIAITMLTGSTKENVLGSEASAVIDLRLLPGQDPQAVIARLQEVMQEPAVKVESLLSSTAHASPLDTVLAQAIAKLVEHHEPGAKVTPNFIAGFTDCNTLRAAGIICYGFMPMHLPLPEIERVHGNDERILISDFVEATLQMHELVREVAGR